MASTVNLTRYKIVSILLLTVLLSACNQTQTVDGEDCPIAVVKNNIAYYTACHGSDTEIYHCKINSNQCLQSYE